jgi:heat shock protein HtpX
MKRILLFLLTNVAVMVVLSITLSVLGVNRFIAAEGLNVGMLVVFSGVVGFTGSFISLLLSKPMAKWSMGVQVIDPNTQDAHQRELVSTVHRLATGGLPAMPEVGGLRLPRDQRLRHGPEPRILAGGRLHRPAPRDGPRRGDGVLGHEVAHIANGDMVTLTLIQGVVNAFAVFFARVVGYFVDRVIFKTERGTGPGYFVTVIVCEIVFGILASIIVMWFSRQREFRADAGAASYLGTPRPMVAALQRLGGIEPGELPKSFQASGISDKAGFMSLFSSHPPIEARIAALESRG